MIRTYIYMYICPDTDSDTNVSLIVTYIHVEVTRIMWSLCVPNGFGRTSVSKALVISIFELGHKMGFNSIEMLLFQPRPKSRLIINPTKHVGKAFFLDRMINLQELGLWS